MQFKVFILLFSAVSLIACSSTQEKQSTPLIQTAPETTLIQKGFSLSLPDQEEWTVVKNNPYKVIMIKQGNASNERYTIQALVVKLPNFKSDEEFMKFISRRMEKSQKKSRVEVLERDVQLVNGEDNACVQYNSIELYPGKLKPVMLEMINFTCRHSGKNNAGVYLAYSKKYSQGNEDKNFEKDATGIFSHLALAEF